MIIFKTSKNDLIIIRRLSAVDYHMIIYSYIYYKKMTGETSETREEREEKKRRKRRKIMEYNGTSWN